MNYRDTFNKFETQKSFNSHKAYIKESDIKPDLALSPRISEKSDSRLYRTIEGYQDRVSLASQKSQDSIPKSFKVIRNQSAFKFKSQDQNSKIEELLIENFNLKEKLEILKKERDLIKQWKKPSNKSDTRVYQEKLNFLVKNIQQFLGSSLKFQSMLREKLGQSVANIYEEERNLLKRQVISAAQEFEIPLRYSPMTSPLRGVKSPKCEDYSSCDSDATKILEELKQEKNKTKRLQSELNNELSKKDLEMQNIRDKLIELESIEKNKIENEKKFFKASQDWQIERKELYKELDKAKFENIKVKENFAEFDKICTEIQKENNELKVKYDEIMSENYKLAESLQTYDRLYNYSKKWAEKVVDEAKNTMDSRFAEINGKINAKDSEILELKDKIIEISEGKRFKDEIYQEFLKLQEKDKKFSKEKFELKAFNDEMSEKNKHLIGRNKNLCESIEKVEKDCEKLYIELQESKNEVNELVKKKKETENGLEGLKREKNKVLEENKELLDRVKAKEQELLQINKELKEIKEKLVENKKNKEMIEEINQLRKILEEKNSQVEELKICGDAVRSNYDLQKQTVIELSDKNNSLMEDFSKISEENCEIIDKNQRNLEEIARITGENKGLKAKMQELTEKTILFAQTQQDLGNKVSQIEEFKNLVKEKEKTIKAYYNEIANLQKVNKEMEETRKEFEAKVSKLLILEPKLERSLKDLQSKEDIIINLKQENENYSKMINDFEASAKETKEINIINQNNKILREKIVQIEDEIKMLKLQNLDLVEKISTKDLQLEKTTLTLQDMQQIIRTKEKSIEILECSLSDRQNLLSTLSTKENYIQKLETKSQLLTAEIKQKDITISSLQNDLLNSANSIKNYESRLKSLEEIPVLQKEVARLQESLTNNTRNANTLEKLLKEKDEQIKIKDNQIREIEQLREKNKSLTETYASLATDNKALKERLVKSEENLKKNEKQLEELKDLNLENYELSEKIDLKEKEIDELNAIHNEEVDILMGKLKEMEAELNKRLLSEQQLEEKNIQIKNLSAQIKSLREQIKKLGIYSPEEFEGLKQQTALLTSENDYFKSSLQLLKNSNDGLLISDATNKETISSLTKELQYTKQDLEKVRRSMNSAQIELNEKNSIISDYSNKLSSKSSEMCDLKDRLYSQISEYEESSIADKEEISRLNSEKMKQYQLIESQKKEINALSQGLVTAEKSLKAPSHCENCESQKEKISELECLIHSAEEALGGFFCNSLAESIQALVVSKTQSLRRAPRPPTLKSRPDNQKRESVDLKPEIADELISKMPINSEGSKRSHSSALSLPDISDLRNELNEEKNESERYLTQIKLLKEHIRELERKLKRTEDVNDNINGEYLKSTFIKLIKSLPLQNNQIEGMISLIFNIINVPKEELASMEPERKTKAAKRFGVF